MKRFFALCLSLGMLLSGCAIHPIAKAPLNATYLDLFDTVTTIISTGQSEEAFRAEAEKIYNRLSVYHQLFDIYDTYEGINNLKTVNDQAGIAPVKVDPAIIDLLKTCKQYYSLTEGKVNVAMGSVLSLWHEARAAGLENPQNAKLPDKAALSTAAEHMDFARVEIDEEISTVFLSDKEMSLDVGAIAKGWALEKVAQSAPAGMLISIGGSVCVTGPKYDDGTPWQVGVQDPDDSSQYLHTLRLSDKWAVATSGDYQRVYEVDGESYHHIIDPATQMPAKGFSSVTVVCADAALADALSTALFLLPPEEGKVLAKACDAHVLWVDSEGNQTMSENFESLL